jgi:hypothetical protein
MASSVQRSFHLSGCILVVLILGLADELCIASQTAPSSGSQASINEEARASYRAGTTAATNNDFKTAQVGVSCSPGTSDRRRPERFVCGPGTSREISRSNQRTGTSARTKAWRCIRADQPRLGVQADGRLQEGPNIEAEARKCGFRRFARANPFCSGNVCAR